MFTPDPWGALADGGAWRRRTMEIIEAKRTEFRPRQHPDRALIDAETHARPVGPLPTSLRIRRAAFMADPARRPFGELIAAIVDRFATRAGDDARQLTFEAAGYQVTAEFHNE